MIEAIISVIKTNKKGEIYNVGTGKPVSINKIVKLLGTKKITYIPKRSVEPEHSLANINKIKKDFNWAPKITIEHGVKKILENIESWKSAPVWTPEAIKEAIKK